MTTAKDTVKYQISFPNPQTHYATVNIEIDNVSVDKLHFAMPVWTPGSYLIREFEKSVEDVKLLVNGKNSSVEHLNKNTWSANGLKGKNIAFSYQIYANEFSVRTSFIDASHAWLHNTSIFMLVEELKNNAGTVVILKPSKWASISTALDMLDNNTFSFSNYDELGDSPIEIGNHEILHFEAMGVPHEIALIGLSNCNRDSLLKKLKHMCEIMGAIIGEHPCKRYVFFIQNVETGGGGLEHKNSCCVMIPRWNWIDEAKFESFMGLCAHEYFHLWNVKRIRPVELGPFDYNNENYTRQLWVAEGITSYYDEIALFRAGYITKQKFIENVLEYINNLIARPGNKVQSLAESSFDAWIKEYRPNENSKNTSISYYAKGLVVAALLDIEISSATNGKKHLDDLMKLLYQRFYKKRDIGFTEREFMNAANEIAGKNLDTFFADYVYTTAEPNYINYFNKVGIDVKKIKTKNLILGVNTAVENGKTIVKSVIKGSPAWWGGLNANDEIIGINGNRVNNDVEQIIRNIGNPGHLTVVISRSGLVSELEIDLVATDVLKFGLDKINSNASQNIWLSK